MREFSGAVEVLVFCVTRERNFFAERPANEII